MDASTIITIIIFIALVLGILVVAYLILHAAGQNTTEPALAPEVRGPSGTTAANYCIGPCPDIWPNDQPSVCSLPESVVGGSSRNPFAVTKPPLPLTQVRVRKLGRLSRLQGKPTPTNSWYTNSLYGPGELVIVSHPYFVNVRNTALRFNYITDTYPDFSVTTRNGSPPDANILAVGATTQGISVGIVERIVGFDVTHYDPLTITYTWSGEYCESQMVIPLVRGSPFITAVFRKATPMLMFGTTTFSFDSRTPTVSSLSRYIINLTPTSAYLLFTSAPLSLIQDGERVQGSASWDGYIRLAYVEYTGDILASPLYSALDQYWRTYPTAGNVTYTDVSDTEVDVTLTWTVGGEGAGDNLLMLALPHHIFKGTTPVDLDMGYNTPIRGPSHLYRGNVWILAQEFPANLTFLPTTGDLSQSPYRQNISEQWERDIVSPNLVTAPLGDIEGFGKQLGALANLLIIGQSLGYTPSTNPNMQNALTTVKRFLDQAMNNTWAPNNAFAYDNNWGGIVTTLGRCDCTGMSDGGNFYYNNHHGHYGYFIFALATVGFLDPSYLAGKRRAFAVGLTRDIANPSLQDPYFPLWRHKDWYTGQSWDTGITPNQAAGKQQESSSEAVNAYYAIYLLGRVLSDDNITLTGKALLGTELHSSQVYYQFIESSPELTINSTFNEVGTVTIWSDTKYEYNLGWACRPNTFPQRHACLIGVEMLPITTISFSLLQRLWMEAISPNLIDAVGYPQEGYNGLYPGWAGYAYAALARGGIDQNTLMNLALTLDENMMVPGTTKTTILWWIAQQQFPESLYKLRS